MELLTLAFVAFVLLGIIRAFLRSPTTIGGRGERRVNRILQRQLPSGEYAFRHDITLPTALGPTQIDHIVISRYGIFVIETKNYSGWIFGDAKSAYWMQVIYRSKNRFQNPLRQNFKHTKAVESFLSLSPQCVYSVVAFVGKAEFKTDLPGNVVHLSELCSFIRSHREILLSTSRVREIAIMLTDHQEGRAIRREPGLAAGPDKPLCPRCGQRMVLRKAQKGKSAGTEFWGCPRFPQCRGIRKILSSDNPTITVKQ
ncbi:nuclease-related domain-containing protein [Lentisalinibacter sediminis]|uniref:nuclease-related domain-containing protein n=1 Tax=Lentisalinibacter sediminis TaxID=2992237 RepID=UPI00386EF506